jgi:hypothetical protein
MWIDASGVMWVFGGNGYDCGSNQVTLGDLWRVGTVYTLNYTAGSNGSLSGATTQPVYTGDNGTTVTAVPDPGYHFAQWNDGQSVSKRREMNVTADFSTAASFVDITPPASTLPPLPRTTFVGGSVNLPFVAFDAGSGVASTSLWVKTPGAGAFVDSGLSQPGSSGSFNYTFAAGDGVYEFAAKATDNAANAEPDPDAAEIRVIHNTVENSTFTWTLASTDAVTTFPMTNALAIVISIAGAQAGGTITVSRTTPLGTPPGGLPAAHLIDESLSIVGAGLGSSWTATITWPFDPNNAVGLVPGYPLNRVFQFDGAVLTQTYTVTPDGATLVIPGVTSFSDWYAGNLSATGIANWRLME